MSQGSHPTQNHNHPASQGSPSATEKATSPGIDPIILQCLAIVDPVVKGLSTSIGKQKCRDLAKLLHDLSANSHAGQLASIDARLMELQSTLASKQLSHSTSHADLSNSPNSYAAAVKRVVERATECEATISLAKLDPKHKLRTCKPAALKEEIEKAMRTSDVKLPSGPKAIRGVRPLANGTVVLYTESETDATQITTGAHTWIKCLDANATPHSRSYQVEAHYVPTSFDPKGNISKESLHNANSSVFKYVENIVDMRWKNERTPAAPGKKHGSMLLTINDRQVASEVIKRGISIEGSLCNVDPYVPPPLQCYRCQGFGHIAAACPKSADPSSLKCARCAGNHSTTTCKCNHTPTCTNHRTCTHIPVLCANCGGPHRSFDNQCPIKMKAVSAMYNRLESTLLFADLDRQPRQPQRRGGN